MTQRIWAVCAALAFQAAPALAKPGDLPVDIMQQCPEGRETDGPLERPRPEFATQPAGDFSPSTPRATGAGGDLLPATRGNGWIDRDLAPRRAHQVRDSIRRVRRAPLDFDATPDDLQAQHLLNLAEQCRREGDYARARICYEEAHLLNPTSRCGRLAIDRLHGLDRERFGDLLGDAEEAEDVAPLPSRRAPEERLREMEGFEEMLKSTVPLGDAEEFVPQPPVDTQDCDTGFADVVLHNEAAKEPPWTAARKCFASLIDVERLSLSLEPAEQCEKMLLCRAFALTQGQDEISVILERYDPPRLFGEKGVSYKHEQLVDVEPCPAGGRIRLRLGILSVAKAGDANSKLRQTSTRPSSCPVCARPEDLAAWITSTIYAKPFLSGRRGGWVIQFEPAPEPPACDADSARSWWHETLRTWACWHGLSLQ
jgi:hypothetical protein